MPNAHHRRRVLFIAEAVTLAHVARATVLAQSLDPDTYDVHVAWDPRYNSVLGTLPFTFHPIASLPTTLFLKRLSRGRPMHDVGTLRQYVREDLATIKKVSPDVIVGDFRISLAASARIAGVPYIAVANAYWSPYGRQSFLFPEYDYPLGNVIGARLARSLFRVLRPIGFAAHTRPLNLVLREHKLPDIGGDIRVMYTAGDYTAYADIPDLVPTYDLPATHRYIGPVLWSPPVPTPGWWEALPPDRPVVYATPGSSGDAELLPVVLQALADLPMTVIAATAGRIRVDQPPANARLADFLPGVQAAARSALVVCNGGSPTTYQALSVGTPVLGITSTNMDQHLNMEAVCRAGAGEVLGAQRATVGAVRHAVSRLVANNEYREAARRLETAHARCKAEDRFPRLVEEVLNFELRTSDPGAKKTSGVVLQKS